MLFVNTSWENVRKAFYELLELIKEGRKPSEAERIFLAEVYDKFRSAQIFEDLNHGTETDYYKKLAELMKKIEDI